MNFAGLFFLLLVHFFTGRCLLELFRLELKPVPKFCLSMISGVAIASLIPFLMELMHIRFTGLSVATGLLIPPIVLLVVLFRRIKSWKYEQIKIKLPEIYELPFLVVVAGLVALSIWRCYYNPPYAWDMLSGPEAMADIAITEKHMINSLFTVDLQYTNNYLKPPYITSLQIIYKLFVQQFGQLWLSVLFVSFILFLFSMLKERLHPVIMYIVMILFFASPEMFSHTYTILFDYSNMIFFFMGFYFLNRYFEHHKNADFAFAIFSFSTATYIRMETLVLLVLMLPLLVFRLFKLNIPFKQLLLKSTMFLLVPGLIYFVFMNIYIKYYIPVHYDVGHELNTHLGDINVLFRRYYDITTKLLFGETAETFFGMQIYLFVAVIFTDLLFFRKKSAEGLTAIYGIFVVFIGLGLLGYLLPLVDLMHTTKRGLFKIFPLILLYYYSSGFLGWVSALITNWETGKPYIAQKETISGIPVAKALVNKTEGNQVKSGGKGKKK